MHNLLHFQELPALQEARDSSLGSISSSHTGTGKAPPGEKGWCLLPPQHSLMVRPCHMEFLGSHTGIWASQSNLDYINMTLLAIKWKPAHCHIEIQIIEHSNEVAVFCKIYHNPFKLQDEAETEREEVPERKSNTLQTIANCLAAYCGRKEPQRFMADLETTTESSASSKLQSWGRDLAQKQALHLVPGKSISPADPRNNPNGVGIKVWYNFSIPVFNSFEERTHRQK